MFGKILHVMQGLHERVSRLEELSVVLLGVKNEHELDDDKADQEREEDDMYSHLKWKLKAIQNDQQQMKKWNKYFEISKTEEQKQMSKQLEDDPIQTTVTHIDYTKIIPRQDQNIEAWLKKDKSHNEVIGDDVDHCNMITFLQHQFDPTTLSSKTIIKGFDPFSNPSNTQNSEVSKTFLTEQGSVYFWNAEVISALFLQHHLVTLDNPNIDFHVICTGYGFKDQNFMWGYFSEVHYDEVFRTETDNYEMMANLLIDSEALKSIRRRKLSKDLRRICIWLCTKGHVFMLCWDEYKQNDSFHHVLSICDNMNERDSPLDHASFRSGIELALLNKKIVQDVYDDLVWMRKPFKKDDIYLRIDFLCVSFMARCTLYFSMFEAIFFTEALWESDREKIGDLKLMYRQFEIDTFEFMSKMINKGHIVMFPPEFDAKFVNINAASLVVMEKKGVCTSYHYAGVEKKFTTKKIKDVRPTCVVSSRLDDKVGTQVSRLEGLSVTSLKSRDTWESDESERSDSSDQESTDSSEEEEESSVQEWEEKALDNDNQQLKRWLRYFDMAKTEEQESMSKKLENTTIEDTTPNIDYMKVIPVQNKNIETWLAHNTNNREIKQDQTCMHSRDLFSRGKLRGFDPFCKVNLLKGQQKTFLSGDGGMNSLHAHSIPALFIQNHIISLQNPNMEFHVLCHGFHYSVYNWRWGWELEWDVYGQKHENNPSSNHRYFAASLLDSEALKKIRSETSSKDIRRICIWLQTSGHVCMLCWDEYRERKQLRHVFHVCDNVDTENSPLNFEDFKEGFQDALMERHIVRNSREMYWGFGPLQDPWMIVEEDFLCVSFMTRYTLILSMFEGFFVDAGLWIHFQGEMGDLKLIYRQFEIDLFEFITEMTNRGNIVLFTPEMDAMFLNINSMSLVVMGKHGIGASYHYAGVEKKFTTKKIEDVSPTCVVSSQVGSSE